MNNIDFDVKYINNRIKNEIDYKILNQLDDQNLLEIYKNTNSVKNKIKTLELSLNKFITDEVTINNIINDYMINLIPPGTKGVIKGNIFNKIVKKEILNMELETNKFEICFEKNNDKFQTNEIPDWYILDKSSNKILIGMNQLDIWNGGQQLNRGMNYLNYNDKNNNIKLICVVCNFIEIKSNKNKIFKIFNKGFKNNTICYINNLKNIICSYFDINKLKENKKQDNEHKKQDNEHKKQDNENKIINDNKKTKYKNKIINDKYYTKLNVVCECIQLFKENINIDYCNDLIIEPSAGNGNFIKDITTLCKNTLFYDIDPEHKNICKKDYLSIDYEKEILDKKINKIHIIGNPPFGKQSSLVKKFIKFSCLYSDTISFILPKSFKKDSLKKTFDINFHLIKEIDLPKYSFLNNNKEYDIPCIFQIWVKKDERRIENEILFPKNFIFVKKDENPDISFRRVGVNAGKINIEINDKNINSHYFIKFINNKKLNDNIDKIKNIKFNTNNTVGPKSISKQEIIKLYNPELI
jgi:hypothetical protein